MITAPMRVKELAEKNGLNISTLASKAGVSKDTVRLYWYSRANMLNWETLIKLSAALAVKPKDLIED